MKCKKLSFQLLLLSIILHLKFSVSQPNNAQSNGHIPDYAPEFTNRRVYGVHYRAGVEPSADYGPIPSGNVNERNRIVDLAGGIESSAGSVYVYDLYPDNNPATRSTVNGFLCGVANEYMLLRKTEESKYDKITYEHFLNDAQVTQLLQQQQQQQQDDQQN